MACDSDGTVSRRPRIHHSDHWHAYSTCRIRYDCLNIAEHELTMCHDGLTKDYHGVSRWYYGCTMTFPFWVFGEAVTDCRPAFRTVRLPSQSPGNWWSPLRLPAWTFNCIAFYYFYYNVVVVVAIRIYGLYVIQGRSYLAEYTDAYILSKKGTF